MKRNAIEKQFKEKLTAREITPSLASWDRLDAMLSVAEKPKGNFKWMYVAASILGFLLLGTVYFNQISKENLMEEDTLVVKEAENKSEIKKVESLKILKESVVEVLPYTKKQKPATESKTAVDSNTVLPEKESPIAEKEIIQEKIPVITRGFGDCLERSGKNQKTEQPALLQKSKYITAEALLASVENDQSQKKLVLKKSNLKVNSSELLTQVDGELDLSFREKAIKAVNQKVKAVKVALNNRNSE